MRLTKEQKESAVNRYLTGENPAAIIVEMKISRSSLYLWVKQHNEAIKEEGDVVSLNNYRKLRS